MSMPHIGLIAGSRLGSCAGFILVAAMIAGSAGAAADLPAPVADWMAKAQRDCPSGFADKGAVQTADLTGDGRPGYIIDPHRLVCAGEPHLFVGDGPASIELFVTLPTGEVVHTGGVLSLAYQVAPSGEGGPPVLSFQTHDPKSPTGSVDSYRWDGQNFALIGQRSMALPPGE